MSCVSWLGAACVLELGWRWGRLGARWQLRELAESCELHAACVLQLALAARCESRALG